MTIARCALALAAIAGCEREAPSCDALARHAQARILARNPLAPIELARLSIRHPFSARITDEDALYIEAACEDWSAEYRLCVIDHQGGGFRCGREDLVWSALPHVRDWLADLDSRVETIAWVAEQRTAAATLEVERLQSELAISRRTYEAWPLEQRLLEAQERQRSAHSLEETCRAKPLDQPACVALLP